jgi:STE24 endopeptidase
MRASVEAVRTGAHQLGRLRVDPLRFFPLEEVERAGRYHRPLYWAAAVGLALEAGVLAALVWSDAGGALDPGSLPWWERTLVYAAIVVVVAAGVETPLAFWRGYLRERRWGFSTQTVRGWFGDRLKALAVNVVVSASLLLMLVALARGLSGWWVVPAAAAFALAAFGLSFVAPALLAPLFHRYRPLDQEPLRSELQALATAAGVPAERVLVEDTSRRTRKANAYVTGLGRTRRVVVSDTLLAAAPTSELRTVVAHELGHRRKRHVLLGTLLSIGAAVVATVVLWALLGTRVADPHQLPLLLLIGLALAVASMPALAAISRRWERSADRYAVELTNDRAAYERALRRLTAANLSDLDPPTLIYLLLFTHPTPAARLAAVRATLFPARLAAAG